MSKLKHDGDITYVDIEAKPAKDDAPAASAGIRIRYFAPSDELLQETGWPAEFAFVEKSAFDAEKKRADDNFHVAFKTTTALARLEGERELCQQAQCGARIVELQAESLLREFVAHIPIDNRPEADYSARKRTELINRARKLLGND